MYSGKLPRKLIRILVLVAAAGLMSACNGGDDSGSGLDDGKDPDNSQPQDQCSIDADEWGASFDVGEVVANWALNGYMAASGDFEVDQSEVAYSLEDVNCAGHKAMVVLLGDTG